MNFVAALKAVFRSPPGVVRQIANNEGFKVASDAYDVALHEIEPYSTRANHRLHLILSARRVLRTGETPGDFDAYEKACEVYDEAVASFTDLADLEPYSKAELDAHTTAVNALIAAFDNLSVAFATFRPTDDLYTEATHLYQALCTAHTLAIVAYANAAECAELNAMEGEVQALKDGFKVMELEFRAANPAVADPVAAKTEASDFKSKVADSAAEARALGQMAKVAKAKAEMLRAKAIPAEMKGEEALRANEKR